MNILCPYCGSTLYVTGYPDFNAPAIQVINCPVCGFPNWIPSNFPIPSKWTGIGVLTAKIPAMNWAEYKKQNPATAANLAGTPKEAALTESIYKEFSVAGGIKESALAVAGTVKNAATGIINFSTPLIVAAITILLLIFLIKES